MGRKKASLHFVSMASFAKDWLVWSVCCYRRWISPLLGPRCRFYPSCSHYALLSLEQFGAWKGVGLTVRRLLRCHPWHAGGIDWPPGIDANHPEFLAANSSPTCVDGCGEHRGTA